MELRPAEADQRRHARNQECDPMPLRQGCGEPGSGAGDFSNDHDLRSGTGALPGMRHPLGSCAGRSSSDRPPDPMTCDPIPCPAHERQHICRWATESFPIVSPAAWANLLGSFAPGRLRKNRFVGQAPSAGSCALSAGPLTGELHQVCGAKTTVLRPNDPQRPAGRSRDTGANLLRCGDICAMSPGWA